MSTSEPPSSASPLEPATTPPRTPLERFLGLFAEVRPGEATNVVLMFANIFLILTAYYVLKVVREGLTIGGVELFGLGGDEIKAYLPAVMTLLLLVVVPAYGALASAVSRVKLLNSTTLFVMLTLVLFFLWGRATGVGTAIGLSFYIYLGIVNVFLIAQFWSFANDIYTERQGKRLFAIIAIGQSLGAVLGPKIAATFATDIFFLLVISAGLFGVCMLLYNIINRREAAANAATSEESAQQAQAPLAKGGGFGLVFKTRYLLLIALMILVTNVVNTTGEYILSNAAKVHSEEVVPSLDSHQRELADAAALATPEASTNPEAAKEKERAKALRSARSQVIGSFYGNFFFWVNLVGVLIQMFVVSRVFKYMGVRAALFVLPVIAFGSYAAFAALGGLTILRLAKTAENATDYSLQNTVKQALFLPTDREAKYKAKAAIDTFFVRFGDSAAAAIVATGLHVLHFGPRTFALVNVGLIIVWVLLNVGIAKEHKKMVPDDRAVEV
jgi:AAA family ATP:ADP antiporter